MKQMLGRLPLKFMFMLMVLSLFNLLVAAQESTEGSSGGESSTTTTTSTKKTTINVSTEEGVADTWYTSPWVWIAGAAAFILLLVALLSNRGRDTVTTSDRVVSKTVERDRRTDI